LPINTLYSYISSTFLNGFINYVTIKKAYCLNRYLAPDDLYMDHEDNIELKVQNPPGSFNWVSIKEIIEKPITKDKVVKLLNEPGRIHHSKLDNDFQDDVLILGKPNNICDTIDGTMYYFFWFDRDCSECHIGRFVTKDCEGVVIEKFDKYVKELNEHNNPSETPNEAYVIQSHYFTGWLKS